MVKITLITNAGKKTVIANETDTLRSVYEKNDVNYGSCTNTIDSVPLKVGDLNKTLAELGVGETCRMSSIVKMDNAANIILAGDACVVKSGVKLEAWKKVLKFEPDFCLTDEDDEPLFRVAIAEAADPAEACKTKAATDKVNVAMLGSLNINGAVFSANADKDGYAVITTVMDPTVKDKKQTVADKLGAALLRLNKLEALVPEKIAAATANEQEIRDAITQL